MRLLQTDKIMELPNGALAIIDDAGRMLAYKRQAPASWSPKNLPKKWDWLKSHVDNR